MLHRRTPAPWSSSMLTTSPRQHWAWIGIAITTATAIATVCSSHLMVVLPRAPLRALAAVAVRRSFVRSWRVVQGCFSIGVDPSPSAAGAETRRAAAAAAAAAAARGAAPITAGQSPGPASSSPPSPAHQLRHPLALGLRRCDTERRRDNGPPPLPPPPCFPPSAENQNQKLPPLQHRFVILRAPYKCPHYASTLDSSAAAAADICRVKHGEENEASEAGVQ